MCSTDVSLHSPVAKHHSKHLMFAVCVSLHIGSNNGLAVFRQKRSDDTNLSELETVIQLQGAKIENQEAKLQQQEAQILTLQAKLITFENSHASTPPVAFTVHFANDAADNGVALGPQQVLKFDSVLTNIGGGYNAQTGIFTAPVSGVYCFFLSIMSTNAHTSVYIAVVKDGSILDVVFAEGLSDFQDQGSTQVTTHLDSGHQVWVQQAGGDAVRGGSWTIFTGYMIRAD